MDHFIIYLSFDKMDARQEMRELIDMAKKAEKKNNTASFLFDKRHQMEISRGDEKNVFSVCIEGFISSPSDFNEIVCDVNDKIYAGVPFEDTHQNKNNLSLDLRRMVIFNDDNIRAIVAQHVPWLHLRFNKVCIVVPLCHRVQSKFASAFFAMKAADPYMKLPKIKFVERARDVRNFI